MTDSDSASDPDPDSDSVFDADSGSDTDSGPADDGPSALDGTVDRTFTCTGCGYATTREAALLQRESQGICVECGDWTVGVADADVLVAAARDAAAAMADGLLTERQALAYLLHEVVGLDRDRVATAIGGSPSNVDNLRRRAAEKVADARRLVATLDAVTPTEADG